MSTARPLPPTRAGFPDRRNAEQMRAHDSIEEKRWRARVAANEARRRTAAAVIESQLTPPLDDPRFLAPYADIDEGKYERYESDESRYGVSHLFR